MGKGKIIVRIKVCKDVKNVNTPAPTAWSEAVQKMVALWDTGRYV